MHVVAKLQNVFREKVLLPNSLLHHQKQLLADAKSHTLRRILNAVGLGQPRKAEMVKTSGVFKSSQRPGPPDQLSRQPEAVSFEVASFEVSSIEPCSFEAASFERSRFEGEGCARRGIAGGRLEGGSLEECSLEGSIFEVGGPASLRASSFEAASFEASSFLMYNLINQGDRSNNHRTRL